MIPTAHDLERVARTLWGDPNRELSSRHELRFGAHGSKSVDLRKLTWFDHEAGEGGGYTELFGLAGEPLPPPSADNIVATYDYRDERGALLFQVVRKVPKKFVQRRPDPDAPGGWRWSTKGVRRVLYRLPELIAADVARTVFIVEGERDCDNLRALGLVATTDPGGAGKWRHEYGQHLRGHDVVILPDNDPQATKKDGTPLWHPDGRPKLPGQDHAAEVRRMLAGVARSVRIIMLPDLPLKGDVSDWIAAGGSADKLMALVQATPEAGAPNGDADHAGGAEVSDAAAEAEIARLAKLPALRYARTRAASAKLLNIPVGMLDKLVTLERGNGADTKGQGRPLDLLPPEPWPDPVDGLSLCTQLVEFFTDHATLPDRGSIALSLWVIHTHCYRLWRYTPRLHVTGPTKRCGKSRVLRLLQLLVCKPLPSSTISASAVYRSIEAVHPSLLIDEADQSVKDKPDLIAVLDGGYERDQSAIRTVGDEHEPRAFDLFAPVALAGIGRLAGQLEDRSIKLPMRRALPSEKSAKITAASEQRGERLQRQIARWVADSHQTLADAKPDVSKLPDRIDDHWAPLYAIASVVGDNWPELADKARIGLSATDDDADSLGEQLIHDIHKVVTDDEYKHVLSASVEWVASADLVAELVGLAGRPWAEMGRARKSLTQNRLARLLSPFHIFSIKVGAENDRRSAYKISTFLDTFARYGLGAG